MKGAFTIETRNVYKILVRKIGSNKPCVRLDADGSVILKCLLQKIRSVRTDWIHMAQNRAPVEISCHQGQELTGSSTCRKYDQLQMLASPIRILLYGISYLIKESMFCHLKFRYNLRHTNVKLTCCSYEATVVTECHERFWEVSQICLQRTSDGLALPFKRIIQSNQFVCFPSVEAH